jgi:hypothetical protein
MDKVAYMDGYLGKNDSVNKDDTLTLKGALVDYPGKSLQKGITRGIGAATGGGAAMAGLGFINDYLRDKRKGKNVLNASGERNLASKMAGSPLVKNLMKKAIRNPKTALLFAFLSGALPGSYASSKLFNRPIKGDVAVSKRDAMNQIFPRRHF